jgi:hypothetical protein
VFYQTNHNTGLGFVFEGWLWRRRYMKVMMVRVLMMGKRMERNHRSLR